MHKEFAPGFRLSIVDMAIILVAICAATLLHEYSSLLSYVILFVVFHFFLFCNLVRMSRIPELIWTACFLLLSTASIKLNLFPMTVVFLLSFLTTAVLIGLEFRKPSYHGILWQRVNSGLESWFSAKDKCVKETN